MAKHVELADERLREEPKIGETLVGPQAAFTSGFYWQGRIGWKGSALVGRTKGKNGRFIDVRHCVREARGAL